MSKRKTEKTIKICDCINCEHLYKCIPMDGDMNFDKNCVIKEVKC